MVAVDLGAKDEALMPGMACSVRFVPHASKDALVVPARAVHEEDDRHVVYVVPKQGKPQPRAVTPGRTEGGNTEILAGLSEGEEILLERPGAKAAPEAAAADKEGGTD